MSATWITRHSTKDTDAQNAFRRVVHQDMLGCSSAADVRPDGYGYTGTAIEWIEHGFKILPDEPARTLEQLEDRFSEDGDTVYHDQQDGEPCSKWGPAGAIEIKPQGWFFFGWVSE